MPKKLDKEPTGLETPEVVEDVSEKPKKKVEVTPDESGPTLSGAALGRAAARALEDGTFTKGQIKGVVGLATGQDPAFIKGFGESEAGVKLLDSMISTGVLSGASELLQSILTIGSLGVFAGLRKAVGTYIGYGSFVRTCIEQYYDVSVKNHWTDPALRKVWFSCRTVPRSHVKGQIDTLKRTGKAGGSFSPRGKDGKEVKIHKAMPVRAPMGLLMLANPDWMPGDKFLLRHERHEGGSKQKRVNAFTHTMLHEIGHAVDNKLGIMSSHKSNPLFGGWEMCSGVASMVRSGKYTGPYPTISLTHGEHAGRNLRLNQDTFYSIIDRIESGDKLSKALESAYSGMNIHAKDLSKMKTALQDNGAVYAAETFKHGWTKTRAQAAKVGAVLGGRVPFSNLQDDKFTYLADSKANYAVSHYQWHAPGEWFAEMYAFYYAGNLEGHPLFDWFKTNIARQDINEDFDIQDPYLNGQGPE